MKLVFIDAEYTGEHSQTTLVSLGLTTLEGEELYLCLNDYDRDQVTEWLRANVLSMIDPVSTIAGDEAYRRLSGFLSTYAKDDIVHLVSAGLGSDLLLLFELYRYARPDLKYFHALHCLPRHLNHAKHFDLNTLLWIAGFDPDTDRDSFVGNTVSGRRHSALHDARLARACFLKVLSSPALQRFTQSLAPRG